MKKLSFLLSFVLCYTLAFSQPVVNRAGSANTVSDARWQAGLNMFLPRYIDTTAANLSKGIDSCGALIYTYAGNTIWLRKCSPKRWEEAGGGSGTIPTFAQVLNAGSDMDDSYDVDGEGNNFTWIDFSDYQYSITGDFRISANSELDLTAGDSMRLKGIDESASTGLYFPLLNPATGALTKIAASSVESNLTFSQSLVRTANDVTLVNDANTDSTVYGNLGSKGWKAGAYINTTGGSPGQIPVFQGGKLFNLQTLSFSPAPSNTYVQFNRNSAFAAVDSFTWIANGLNIKGRYMIDGAPVVYQPDQSGSAFLNSIFYGSLPASLTHSTSITGQYNTGVGKLALNALISGSSNTGVGARAGQSINTGINNTLVGDGAGVNISSGGSNTAVGMAALASNLTSSNNTAVGFESLRATSAANGTAIGWRSLHETTSGADNTGLGADAGFQNLTGARNTYVGSGSGTGVASNSNSNNTAVGYRSLFGITTGGGNIAIGDSAAFNTTTGIRNLVIGTNITTSAAAANFEMNIGGLLFGTGLTATGTGTAGLLGVGIASPISKFHVSGSARITDTLTVGGTSNLTGGVGIATSGSASYGLQTAGTWTTSSIAVGGGITPAANTTGAVVNFNASITENATGTHPLITELYIPAPTITNAGGSTTHMATVTIGGIPTGITPTGTTSALRIVAGDILNVNGNMVLATAGNKINIATGSNASAGVSAAMTAGTITISTTAVTSSSLIFLTHATLGGTQGILSVGTIVDGTSFVINSSSALDTGTVNYLIIN